MTVIRKDRTRTRRQAGELRMPPTFTGSNARLAKLAAMVCERPWVFAIVRFVKTARTKTALLLVVWCLTEGLYFRERPFSLVRPNVWVVVGLLLVAGGLTFRLAALGCIRKKERLAIHGVYSLCRHPLYLGSILLAYGFCTLLADLDNFVLATVYFVVFYVLTILWEEIQLGELYGEAHSQYCVRTPRLLPFGGFRAGAFAWQAAMSQGGCLLLVAVVMLLVSVQVMAVAM